MLNLEEWKESVKNQSESEVAYVHIECDGESIETCSHGSVGKMLMGISAVLDDIAEDCKVPFTRILLDLEKVHIAMQLARKAEEKEIKE